MTPLDDAQWQSPRTRDEVIDYLTMLRDYAGAAANELTSDDPDLDLAQMLFTQCGENARDHLIDAIGETLTLLGVPNGGD